MNLKGALLRGVAFSATAALSLGLSANADAATKKKHHHAAAHASAAMEENKILREEVEALKARLDAQGAAMNDIRAQLSQTQAQTQQTQAQVVQATADAQAAQDKIETIPEQVNVAVGALPKPKTDAIYVKGVKITLGGFIEAAGIYRSKSTEADIASSFTAIPYSGPGIGTSAGQNAPTTGHTQETRFTARQSRISGLVEGDFDPVTHLSAYGEFDFIAAAQTANSNESNSYNLRIRNLYTTVDRTDIGLHILAGQNWSLATMNGKGITPRNEVLPPQIDAQYIPGFVWARQPQFRITEQVSPELWVAASAENPQTTFYTSNFTLDNALRESFNGAAGSGFNSANTLSFNHVPDLIAKAAYEPKVFERQMHFEVFGIARDFYYRQAQGIAVVAPATPGGAYTFASAPLANQNRDTWGGGVGFGAQIPIIPKLLDFQASGLAGRGIGRYGSSQLSDVTFDYLGAIKPIYETMFLTGLTLHATPALDLYAFGGQEQENRTAYAINGKGYGLGSTLYNNAGCFAELPASGSCSNSTRTIVQFTTGFWDKVYQGSIGQFRVGLQYSWTDRIGFLGVGGAPRASDNMLFLSVRYYPFQ